MSIHTWIQPGRRVTVLNEAIVGTVVEYPAIDPEGVVHDDLAAVDWGNGIDHEEIAGLYSAEPSTDDTVEVDYRTYDGNNLLVDTRNPARFGDQAMIAEGPGVSLAPSGTYDYVALTPDVARAVGTFLIHCSGNPSLHGENTWIDEYGVTLRVFFEDGQPTFQINDGRMWSTTPLHAVDMGQRLICWAGVAV